MTPKEKAQELFNKYLEINYHYYQAKDCALIAVDEILHVLRESHPTELVVIPMDLIDYWFDVKKEIETL